MRKIDILNKNYEVANLNTVVYEGYSIKQIIEDSPVFSVTPPQHYLDYWQKIYDYLKDGTQLPGHTYIPSGQSKYDIAYINKTIDDPIVQNSLGDWLTLRDIFESGNLIKDVTWSSNGSTGTISYVNGYLRHTLTNSQSFNGIVANLTKPIDNSLLYIRQTVKYPQNDNNHRLYVYGQANVLTPLSIIAGIEYTQSIQYQNIYTANQFVFYDRNTGIQTNGMFTDRKEMFIVNQSLLRITHLSLTQMNDYYTLYNARKNITKKQLTYADIFEEFNLVSNSLLNIDINGWFQESGATSVWDNGRLKNTAEGISNVYGRTRTVLEGIHFNGEEIYIGYDYQFGKTPSYLMTFLRFSSSGSLVQDLDYSVEVGTGYKSHIFELTFDSSTLNLFISQNYESLAETINAVMYFDNIFGVSLNNFDESITKEQLDLLRAYYLIIKDIVIYPENFIPLEPTGFGNRYKFKELNTKVYGHEMDFEKIQLTLLFGTYRNAYESFNLLMNFMINNEAIISYDYGKGIRYTDVRLIAAPKTELDNGQHMRSKFDFKRLSPFYTIEEGSTLMIKNVHDWDIKPIVSGTVNTNIVYIEAEDTTTSVTIAVKFDFTSLAKPFNFYYNAETKQILINGINNGYQYIDFSYGVSFISLPKDTEHLITTTGITSPVVKAKKWVID